MISNENYNFIINTISNYILEKKHIFSIFQKYKNTYRRAFLSKLRISSIEKIENRNGGTFVTVKVTPVKPEINKEYTIGYYAADKDEYKKDSLIVALVSPYKSCYLFSNTGVTRCHEEDNTCSNLGHKRDIGIANKICYPDTVLAIYADYLSSGVTQEIFETEVDIEEVNGPHNHIIGVNHALIDTGKFISMASHNDLDYYKAFDYETALNIEQDIRLLLSNRHDSLPNSSSYTPFSKISKNNEYKNRRYITNAPKLYSLNSHKQFLNTHACVITEGLEQSIKKCNKHGIRTDVNADIYHKSDFYHTGSIDDLRLFIRFNVYPYEIYNVAFPKKGRKTISVFTEVSKDTHAPCSNILLFEDMTPCSISLEELFYNRENRRKSRLRVSDLED